jgi:hypothetical protein
MLNYSHPDLGTCDDRHDVYASLAFLQTPGMVKPDNQITLVCDILGDIRRNCLAGVSAAPKGLERLSIQHARSKTSRINPSSKCYVSISKKLASN